MYSTDPVPAPTGDTRSNNEMLQALARRVRALRKRLRWSRAELADRSGISMRFLARVESGDGNISLVRLQALARALRVTPQELITETKGPPVVSLVGLRGAGKSTVGPELARRLSVPFVEVDTRIEEAAGLPLDQLFELHGERYYRRLEREALARVLAEGRPAVLAAAGGVVNEPATWELLRQRSLVVWLKARPEDHWNRVVHQGDRRPMADNPDAMAELRAMLAAREPLYAEAHCTVDTSQLAPGEIVARVESHLRELPVADQEPW
jgi:XRE family aerobic/anaerobic benzoate catabolism transcriptional regulator